MVLFTLVLLEFGDFTMMRRMLVRGGGQCAGRGDSGRAHRENEG